ncbi:MAG: hypothetical protein H6732_17885 [Alphaproteobacteria bacterium]|nr:hypothetical protein [Alphaproteobacteria bacterium]
MWPSPTPGVVAFVVTVACWALTLPGALDRHPALVRALPWLGTLGALGAAAWLVGGPEAVPTDLILVLKEGRETDLLGALSRSHPWLAARDTGASPPLRDVVWLHLGVVGLSALLLGGIAVATGALRALPVALVVLASPWGVHAVLSETPAAELLLLVLLGAGLADARHGGGASRLLGVVGLVAATLAGAALRPEAAILGAAATAGVLVDLAFPIRRPVTLSAGALRLLVALGLVALGGRVLHHGGPMLPLALPFEPTSRTAPALHRLVVDATAFVSGPAALLALLGLALLPARSWTGVFLVAGTLGVAKILGLAAHDGHAPYETLRYGAILLGPLALAALEPQRRLGPRPLVDALLLGTVLVGAALRPVGAPDALPEHPWQTVETTQVVGARWWMDVRAAHPDCLLVSRLAIAEDDDAPQARMTFLLEPAHLGGPLGWAAPRKRFLREDPPCTLFVAGMDCNLTGVDCGPAMAGWRFGEERTGTWPEHNTHHGAHRQPLRLMVLTPP